MEIHEQPDEDNEKQIHQKGKQRKRKDIVNEKNYGNNVVIVRMWSEKRTHRSRDTSHSVWHYLDSLNWSSVLKN